MINITKTPKYIETAFNPILFEASYDNYTLGDMFYLELLDVNNNVLTTLVKNGNGFGFCSFDVSSILQTLFPKPKTLNANVLMQQDETALIEYKVKLGLVELINKTQIKHECYQSGLFYALRAALAFDGSESVDELTVDYTREAIFLTDITPNQTQGQDLYLPVLVTAPTTVKLVCNYYTSRKETTHTIPSAGVYVFNAKPELQGMSATGLSVWLESTTQTYLATVSTTVHCSTGYTGSYTATATEYSTVSVDDAATKAALKATDTANANLVCVVDESAVTYTATKSYTATCGSGYEGTATSTQTRTSTVSQADADTKAYNAAKADAEASLVCTPASQTTYTSTKSYTATCGTGYEGSYTSTKTVTSTISQADADTKAFNAAKADAEANLVCTPDSTPKDTGMQITDMYINSTDAEDAPLMYVAYTPTGTFSAGQKVYYGTSAGNAVLASDYHYFRDANGTLWTVETGGYMAYAY